MPREKKQSKAKRFRASSDSDLVSQTESEHSNTSEPSSPRKKHKKPSAKQAAASGSTPDLPQALLPPQPLHASHISAANPFDDAPNSVPQPSHPGFMARRMMNSRAMNAAPPPFPGMMMNSGYPRGGIPPGAYPPPGPPNGPPMHHHHHPPMYSMGNHPRGPPIFICGICRMDIHEGEETILCESGCNMWFHRVCTGLTEAAYSLLTTEQLAEWACDRCIREKKIPLVKMKSQQVTFSASN